MWEIIGNAYRLVQSGAVMRIEGRHGKTLWTVYRYKLPGVIRIDIQEVK